MGTNGMPDVTPADVLAEARSQVGSDARELGGLVLALGTTAVVAVSGSFPDLVPLWWLLIGAIGADLLGSAVNLGSSVRRARWLRCDPVAAELAAQMEIAHVRLEIYRGNEQAAGGRR